MMRPLEVYPGDKFGKWTVLSTRQHMPNGKDKRTYCYCVCECGMTAFVPTSALVHGLSKSCGCAHEITPHKNLSRTRVYSIWRGMIKRCNNPKIKSYKFYGGKGIKVCDEWANDFTKFYDWAMSSGYKDGLTIDRIDGEKDYSPDNCRWATVEEQANNTKATRHITFNGETKTVTEWARSLGMTRAALNGRLYGGWSIEKALTTPVNMNLSRRKAAI